MSIQPEVYEAGYTRRWHTFRNVNQSVAEHSWGTAMMILAQHPNPSANLLKAALMHDLHETRFGDLPGPTKRSYPAIAVFEQNEQRKFWAENKMEYPDLTDEEQWWLNYADKQEALVFLLLIANRNDARIDQAFALAANQVEMLQKLGGSIGEKA